MARVGRSLMMVLFSTAPAGAEGLWGAERGRRRRKGREVARMSMRRAVREVCREIE